MQQVQRPDHAPAVSKRSINILVGNTHSVLITDESRFGYHQDSRRTRIWTEPAEKTDSSRYP